MGDRVAWTLVLQDDDLGLAAAVVEVQGQVVPGGLEDGHRTGVALRGHGLTVWWPDGKPGDGVVRVRGVLREDHHADAPETLPPTRGVVRRIQVVTHTYEPAGRRRWELAPVAPRLRDVERLPTRFASGQGDVHTSETGVLADLEAPPAP